MSTFLAMSVSGGALILVIAVLRVLFAQRLPRRLLCALWAAALLRLLLPVFPPSPLSLFPAVESGGGEALPAAVASPTAAPQAAAPAAQPASQAAAPASAAPAVPRAAAMPQTAPAPQAAAAISVERPAPPVWPIVHGSVAALLLILLIALYARGLRRFRASAPCEDGFARQWLARHPLRRPLRLRLCAAIDAPLTYGLLRPVILLPAGFDLSDREALDCVLRHELAHVRRFDALFKAALAVTACLHWFNPLVWVMLALANRDLELACDEQALRAAARERRRAYARALLRLEEMRARPLPLGSAFGKSGVEERIAAIVKRRPVSRAALALTLLLAALTLAAFTAPAAPASAPEATPTPAADSTEVGVSATPAPLTTPEQPAVPETISLSPLPEEAFAVYAPYDLKYEDGVLRLGWSAVRCFTDTGLSGYAPGTYLQNFHGNTDVFAIRDEYGTLTGLNWSFPGLDIYDACTQVIARAYEAEDLPTPTPQPERTPEPTPTAASLAPLPEELSAYAPYGLTANEDGTLTYLGSSVRFLIDEAAGLEMRWDTGGVGAYAVRDASGALTGLRAANWDEFAQETGAYDEAAAPAYATPPDRAADNWGVDRATLAAYEPFGVTWVEDMPVYLGVPIRYIFDEAMQYAPLTVSRLNGQTDVYAVRDASGSLTGLRAATAEEFAQNTAANYLAGASDAYRATPAAWPRAEVALLAAGIDAYAPYGLRVENGLPFFRDVSVRFFVDAGAGLNLMCYYWGEVDMLVERDESGAIAALRPSTRAEFEQKTQDGWEELRADYAAPEDANAAYNWNGRDELSTATGTVPVSLYEPYGLGMYDGRLYYGEDGVRSFLDEALGVEAYSHLPTATLDLRAVRDANGALTGLRVATAEETAAGEDEMHEGDAPPQQGGPLGSVEPAEAWY